MNDTFLTARRQNLVGELRVQPASIPNIQVGETVTLAPGTSATVELDENSTKLNPIFNFGIPAGQPGEQGINGTNGYTPIKGTDYWTETDKTEIVNEVVNSVDLTNYVDKDYNATYNRLGLVKTSQSKGLGLSQGLLYVCRAVPSQIDLKMDEWCPITPKDLDYAIKVGITTNTNPLTDEEKEGAQNWLGIPIDEMNSVISKVGGIQGVNTEITEASYNDYVPSTKAVYDYVNAQLGDIETALAALVTLPTEEEVA